MQEPILNSSPTKKRKTSPDFSNLPPTFVLPAHLAPDKLHDVEDRLLVRGAPLTYDAREARVFVGRVERERRAVLELRSRGVWTKEIVVVAAAADAERLEDEEGRSAGKRPRLEEVAGEREEGRVEGDVVEITDESSTESESEPRELRRGRRQMLDTRPRSRDDGDIVRVVTTAWLDASVAAGRVLPFQKYTVYRGRIVQEKPLQSQTPSDRPSLFSSSLSTLAGKPASETSNPSSILARARQDAQTPNTITTITSHHHHSSSRKPLGVAAPLQDSTQHHHHHRRRLPSTQAAPTLLHKPTSSHSPPPDSSPTLLQPTPGAHHHKYSCQRPTPLSPPNKPFLTLLKHIRLTRKLASDEIGVRAYSTSIAALASYPYPLSSPREVRRLPGCSAKTAALWLEYSRTGTLAAVQDADADERLRALRVFYGVWGVGPATAREWYDRNGWRDLEDVVERGWGGLSRAQQLGVKYHEEFRTKIPRAEVEGIRGVIAEHLGRVRGGRRRAEGWRTCVVGGYRRGKAESGDADVVVSHLEEGETVGVVDELVASLHEEGWVTHFLRTEREGSRRGQGVRPVGAGSHGFDALDKAMVVWQDPRFEDPDADGHALGDNDDDKEMRRKRRKKNPNIHRRVDIIVAPWSKVGCAVLGWSAGPTFERDLRRYAEKEKGWRFDSSGIRDRATGRVVDLEGVGGRCNSIEEAERKVFEGLGLEWREPWERCTG